MFLAEPSRTPYDLRFDILGFSVRVTPFFWLVAVILGYEWSVSLHELLPGRPSQFFLLVMWMLAVFVSILVHELGHALAMRYYGQHAYIVLYHFGGLAIPDVGGSFVRHGRRGRPENQIIIALAGPGAQLLLAIVIVGVLRLAGLTSAWEDFYWPINLVLRANEGRPLSPMLDVMLLFLILPSVSWALINLLPIFPLDGGQVSRSVLTMFSGSRGVRDSLVLSIAAAGTAAIYFYSRESIFNAMLFASLGVSSYQLLQTLRFGGGTW